MNRRLTSSRFPYLPLQIEVRQRREELEAFVDTGFDGDVAVPPNLITNGEPPDGYVPWRLADGSLIFAPAYLGAVRVGEMGTFPVVITAIGDEPLLGRGLTDRFKVTFDHGRQIILEA